MERKRKQAFDPVVVWSAFRTFGRFYNHDRKCRRTGDGYLPPFGQDAQIQFRGDQRLVLPCDKLPEIPVQVLAWDNITVSSLALDACAVPFVLLGGVFGILLVKRLPEKGFRYFTTAVTCVSVLMLLV